MNLKYLGDALDHWKGSLFECLQFAEVLRDLAADPMAADQDQWSDADFSLYARLLHIRQEQVIRHKESLFSRDSYFAEIVHQGDLFLDPDTGVATVQRGPSTLSRGRSPRFFGPLLDAS
jgi:hypothetical protein